MKRKTVISLLVCFFVFSYSQQIAFLSDVHFQDLYGSFSDNTFDGVPNPSTEKKTLLRSMESQLHSTRIFNENYFAFLAALNDIAMRGIKIVALPGDYTDNGQMYNLRGLKDILEQYHQKYGIRFFITTGNHDPVGPFRKEAGNSDFLGNDGLIYGIYSSEKQAGNLSKIIISKDVAECGYLEILNELKAFGFYPDPNDSYWSTPFDSVLPEKYTYQEALKSAEYSKRMYEVSPGFTVPDLSYVTEPLKGIWLLAIDGNTYLPKRMDIDPNNPENYKGASIGYNNVMTHKKHLIYWVKKVAEEAKKRNKILLAFTHYPMIDYNDGATQNLKHFFGEKKWQLERVPEEEVSRTFAEAGIQIHFAGHMHLNDTGIRKYEDGNFMVNIQVPSLAAYLPAYKILTIKSTEIFDVQTVILDDVPRFDELFPFYRKEHEVLTKSGNKKNWNESILKAKSYREFMQLYFQQLVTLRFIPNDWPKEFIRKTKNLSGKDILLLAGKEKLNRSDCNISSFGSFNFNEMILDMYKFQNADELAKRDIPKQRLEQYECIFQIYKNLNTQDAFLLQLKEFFDLFEKLMKGDAPSDHFQIDLRRQTVVAE